MPTTAMPCGPPPWRARLEELGVLRSFSRPRVSNDNPYSESLFRTVKYRPDYPRRPFRSKDEACLWVACIRGLVQPPAPPQRHPVRDAPPAPQRPGQRDLSAPFPCLRAGPPATSPSLVAVHPLLASAGGGLDQSTPYRKRPRTGYVGDGRLIGGRGVIFPGRSGSGLLGATIRCSVSSWGLNWAAPIGFQVPLLLPAGGCGGPVRGHP